MSEQRELTPAKRLAFPNNATTRGSIDKRSKTDFFTLRNVYADYYIQSIVTSNLKVHSLSWKQFDKKQIT